MCFVLYSNNTPPLPPYIGQPTIENNYLFVFQTSNNVFPKAVIFPRELRAVLKCCNSELTILACETENVVLIHTHMHTTYSPMLCASIVRDTLFGQPCSEVLLECLLNPKEHILDNNKWLYQLLAHTTQVFTESWSDESMSTRASCSFEICLTIAAMEGEGVGYFASHCAGVGVR